MDGPIDFRACQGRALLTTCLRYLQLAYFSNPAGDRVIYRLIRRRKVRKILEIGIGTASRAVRMIDLARRGTLGEAVRYVAIDLFESRGGDSPRGLSLKDAHRLLKSTAAQVQLIPGHPQGALARSANALQNIDLVIISAEHDDKSLEGVWFYLPRMLHADSTVLRESCDQATGAIVLTLVERGEILARAAAKGSRAA
jgi:hypothetical protein